jgi:hypothetical protein
MNGIVETLGAHLFLRSGAKLRDLAVGHDAELRSAIHEALVLAAEDTELPQGITPTWFADVFFEGTLRTGSTAPEVSGIESAAPLELESPDFSSRLRLALPPQLIDDLENLGLDTSQLTDAFGLRFRQVIRAHATSSTSHLHELATRIEAETLYRVDDAIAQTLGVNLEGTRDTLSRLRADSRQRMLRRLDALAVPDEKFDDLLLLIYSAPTPPISRDGLHLLLADAGSGKSTLAERYHLQVIDLAERDPNSALPVYIEARRLDGSLDQAIARVWGADANLPARGVDLVIDGLDEIGLAAGRQMLLDARMMLRDENSPLRRVVVTSRPLDFGLKIDPIEVDLLSDEEATNLVGQLSGQTHPAVLGYPPMVREAVRRPFFAIAVGLAIRESPAFLLPTTAKVIESVVRRALADTKWEDIAELLGRVAAASVDSKHGQIPISKLSLTGEEQLALRSSRLTRIENDQVEFDVILIAEWFAAQHLRRNLNIVNELAENPERLDLWRYALLLAVESEEADQIEPALVVLATRAPAMAGWILSQPDAFEHGGMLSEDDVELDAHELATRLRLAFKSLGEGLETASRQMVLFSSNNLLPIALATRGRRCDYAWHRDGSGLPQILDNLPSLNDMPPGEWISYSGTTVTDHPAWPWRHAQWCFRDMLEAEIKRGAVFSGSEISVRESQWSTALEAIGRRGSLNPEPITRAELAGLLKQRDDFLRQIGHPDARDDLRTSKVRGLVADMELAGIDELSPPWDRPDHWHDNRGWVWGIWTEEGLLNRARRVCVQALELYKNAVDGALQHFAPQLRLSASWPVRIVGYMTPARFDREFGRAPHFLWYLDTAAVEPGADWQLVEDTAPIARSLYEEGRIRRWSSGDLHGIYTTNPATALATYLLSSDLQEWGWVGGSPPPG